MLHLLHRLMFAGGATSIALQAVQAAPLLSSYDYIIAEKVRWETGSKRRASLTISRHRARG
jgi:hypothetical protein